MFQLFLFAVGKSELVELFELKPREVFVIAVLLNKLLGLVKSFKGIAVSGIAAGVFREKLAVAREIVDYAQLEVVRCQQLVLVLGVYVDKLHRHV